MLTRPNLVFADIADELTGFIAISLVDIDTGMMVAEHQTGSGFDLTSASALASELIKQQSKTARLLELEGGIDDVMVLLRDQIHLLRMVSDATFILLVASREAANVAILRNALSARAEAFV